jgi:protocatechuate 4,5-dioxygenase beta chain
MGKVIGGITTSHIPAIGGAIGRGAQNDPYWKPFFDGYPPVRQWLDYQQPDVAIVVYNDHGLNFFLDAMPTFAIGAAAEYSTEDEGWGLKPVRPFKGDPALSWHIIESLVADEFDITTCQEMKVDHGFTVPMSLMWSKKPDWPCRVIPVCINTVQHPLPKPSRCFELGKAIGKAIESYPENTRVVVFGTGGLSHQLDGERAGFINREFDEMCMEKIVTAPEDIARLSIHDLVELSGAQGVELIDWLVMRGAMTGQVSKIHGNYHVPVSNTAAGLILMENVA